MNVISPTNDSSLSSLVSRELDKAALPPSERGDVQVLCQAFFARISDDDTDLHSAADWARVLVDLLAFARQRQRGSSSVRVLSPEAGNAARSILQVVTDDMPFLVDTVSMMVSANLQIHAVIHPVLMVSRDASGRLLKIGDDADADAKPESIMHFEIDRVADDAERAKLTDQVEEALEDVRAAVGDWSAMKERALAIAAELPARRIPDEDAAVEEASEFMRWVADDNFTFLGYRKYEVCELDGEQVLKAVGDSGLGILRTTEHLSAPRSLSSLVANELPQSGAIDAIILTKTNARSHVHRAGYMDYIGVLTFDEAGRPIAEQRFLGMFSSNAYMARPQDVPLVRRKVATVLERSGLKRDSHSGKSLRHILETFPRDELFQSSADELFVMASGVLELRQRPRTRLFVRRDRYDRFYTCMVFVPRERFNTSVRERIEDLLREALHGEYLDSAVLMGEDALARLHLVVRPKIGDHASYSIAELEKGVAAIVRNWHDDVRAALQEARGDHDGVVLANRYGKALPAGYVDEVAAEVAAEDVYQLSLLKGDDAVRMSFYHPQSAPESLRFKIYRSGRDIALSEVLPQLENLGLRVLTEHVYSMQCDGMPLFIQDFEVQPASELTFTVEQVGSVFEDAFEQIWRGNAENDGFNRLVLGAKLSWRQIAMLRGYCKYLLQAGISFSQSYMEDALNHYPGHRRVAGRAVPGALRPTSGRSFRRGTESRRCHPGGGNGNLDSQVDPDRQPGSRGRFEQGALAAPRRADAHGRGRHPAVAGERRQPRRGPHPAQFPGCCPRDAADQLLPALGGGLSPVHQLQVRFAHGFRVAQAGAVSGNLRQCATRSRASICASVRWRAAACAGPTGARISAPRCWAWSRRRWSRTR